MTYTVDVKEIRRKVLPELDDEFAKDLGEFESLDALRDRVRGRPGGRGRGARDAAGPDRAAEAAGRAGDVSSCRPSLVEREIDRRLEEFARQLMQQNIDPRQAGIDWAQFREAQREPARAAVASALVLDEIARRENITVAPKMSIRRSNSLPCGPGGRRRRCGPSSRRKAASPGCRPGCAGRRRLTWRCRVLR